jgi:hypothetical protein
LRKTERIRFTRQQRTTRSKTKLTKSADRGLRICAQKLDKSTFQRLDFLAADLHHFCIKGRMIKKARRRWRGGKQTHRSSVLARRTHKTAVLLEDTSDGSRSAAALALFYTHTHTKTTLLWPPVFYPTSQSAAVPSASTLRPLVGPESRTGTGTGLRNAVVEKTWGVNQHPGWYIGKIPKFHLNHF